MMTQGKGIWEYEVDRKITLSVVNREDLVIDINIILNYVGVSDWSSQWKFCSGGISASNLQSLSENLAQ